MQGSVDMDISDLVGKAQEGDLEGEDPVDPIRFVATVSEVGLGTRSLQLLP